MDSIIEFMTEMDRTHVALPAELGALIARFARTGVQLPGGGLNVDDVLLSPEVSSLFKEDESHLHVPESYLAEIRRVVEAQPAVASNLESSELAHELDEDYVRYCLGQRPARPAGQSPAGFDHARGRGRVRHGLHRARAAFGRVRPVRAAARAADPIRGPREARPAQVRGPHRARVLPGARIRRGDRGLVSQAREGQPGRGGHGLRVLRQGDRAAALRSSGRRGAHAPAPDAAAAAHRAGRAHGPGSAAAASGRPLARAAQHAVPSRRMRRPVRPRAPGAPEPRQRPAGAARMRPLPPAGRRGGRRARPCARSCTRPATAWPMRPSRRRAPWA